MVYRKKTTKRKYKKKQYSKRKPFSKKQVKAIVKIASKSTELKSKELSYTDSSITGSGGFYQRSLSEFTISQGPDNDERQGDKIRVKDMSCILRILPGSAGYDTTNGHDFRVLVYQELGINSIASSMPDPLSFFPRSEDVDSKYKVLYNKIYKLQPDDTNNIMCKINLSGKRLKDPVFDDAATTIHSNNIRVMVIPLTTTANQLQVVSKLRLRWYD